MQRHYEYEALILKIAGVGEGNNLIDFLVRDESTTKTISAFFFGARKTKKHYGIQQFQTGKVWLYYNPVNETYKFSDFKASVLRPGLTENLTRIWCASLASELALKMQGNLGWNLINVFFDGIAASNEAECIHAMLRFLWRVIYTSGIAPELSFCGSCGEEFSLEPRDLVYFNHIEGTLFCRNCVASSEGAALFGLSGESLYFLNAIIDFPPAESRKLLLSPLAIDELKRLLFFLVEQLVGTKLNTLTMFI